MSGSVRCWLDEMPEAVIMAIVLRCADSSSALFRLMRVCKRFYVAVTTCVQRLEMRSGQSGKLQVMSACRFPNLTDLVLQDGPDGVRDAEVLPVLYSCRALRALSLDGARITDTALSYIARYCSSLKRLSVARNSLITDEGIRVLMASTTLRLQALNLSSCSRLTDAALDALRGSSTLRWLSLAHNAALSETALRGLSRLNALDLCDTRVGGAALDALTKHNPLLLELSLSLCAGIEDTALELVLPRLRNLRTLRLASLPALSDGALAAAARHCPELQVLDGSLGGATGEAALQELCTRCARLRDVRLTLPARAGSVPLRAPALLWLCRLARLESLELDDASALTAEIATTLNASCPQLQRVVLGWAPALSDAGLASLARCSTLRALEAHGLPQIGPKLWLELVVCARSLEHLVLSGDRLVSAAQWTGDRIATELRSMWPALQRVQIVAPPVSLALPAAGGAGGTEGGGTAPAVAAESVALTGGSTPTVRMLSRVMPFSY